MGDNNENWRSELEDINGLSLIDVSTEDDNLLLFSSFLDPINYEFSGNFRLLFQNCINFNKLAEYFSGKACELLLFGS